jgi:hypothetical protein
MILQAPQADESKQKLRDSLHHRRDSNCRAANLGDERGKRSGSITLKDGSNVKFLIKSPQADALEAARKEGISKEKISSYEISQLGTALNIGESPLPLGVAVKIAN